MVREKLMAGDVDGAALEAAAMPLGVQRATAQLAVEVTRAVLRCVQTDGNRREMTGMVEALPQMPDMADIRRWLLELLSGENIVQVPAVAADIHPYGEPGDARTWLRECDFAETELALLLHGASKVRDGVGRALLHFEHGVLLEFHRLLREAVVARMAGNEEACFDAVERYVRELHASGAPAPLVAMLWKRMNMTRIQLRGMAVPMPKELRKLRKNDDSAQDMEEDDPDASANAAQQQARAEQDGMEDDEQRAGTPTHSAPATATVGDEALPDAAELLRIMKSVSAGEQANLPDAWGTLLARLQRNAETDPVAQTPLLRRMLFDLFTLLGSMPQQVRGRVTKLFKWTSTIASLREDFRPGATEGADLDVLAAGDSQEAKVYALFRLRAGEDIGIDALAASAYEGQPPAGGSAATIRRCVSVLNRALRAKGYAPGIIRQAEHGTYRLITKSSIPPARYEGIASPDQLKTLEYFLEHDRQPLTWEQLYRALHADDTKPTHKEYKYLQHLVQRVGSAGFLVVRTGSKGTDFDPAKQGLVFSAHTAIPPGTRLTFDQYVLVVTMLRAKGEAVSRKDLIDALADARATAGNRLPAKNWTQDLKHAMHGLSLRISDFATLDVTRSGKAATGKQAAMLACALRCKKPPDRDESEALVRPVA